MKKYYFDNATTSFPKPIEVAKDMYNFINEVGGTYGRVNTKRGKETTYKIEECRELLAKIIGTKKENHIIFTSGATRSINDILIGLDLYNTNILISNFEHNATLRPIHQLSKKNKVNYYIIPSFDDGIINLEELKKLNKKLKPSLVVINMQSNISGVIQNIKSIKETIEDTLLLVDATQAIGVEEIKVDEWDIDFLAFTGHKSLLGPTGTGGFYIKDDKILKPSYFGGGFGDSFETPYSVPEIFESGTPNTVGIIGLLSAIKNKPNWNIDKKDIRETIEEIIKLNKYKVIYSKTNQGFVFSIVCDNMPNITQILYDRYNIECRYGFHCSFISHNFYNNKNGAIRFSFSPYNTKEELQYLIRVLKEIDIYE